MVSCASMHGNLSMCHEIVVEFKPESNHEHFRIGRNVSTKSPASKFSWDREDVTSQYKFPEGKQYKSFEFQCGLLYKYQESR